MGSPVMASYVGFTYFNIHQLFVYVTMKSRIVVEKNSAVRRTSVFIAAQ